MANEIHMGKLIRNRLNEIPGMTIKTFAEKLSVHEQTIYDIFKRSDINTDLLRRVADILEVPVSYFFQDFAQTEVEAPVAQDRAAVLRQTASPVYTRPAETPIFAAPAATPPAQDAALKQQLAEARMKIEFLESQLKDKELIIRLLTDKLGLK